MTDSNPIPACLSHLAQRDAAVRARALEDVRPITDIQVKAALGAVTNELPESIQYCLIRGLSAMGFAQPSIESWDIMRAALEAAISTPPAPAPDEAAIRAELVAALLDVVGLVQLVLPTLDESQRIGVEFNPRFTSAVDLLRRIGAWK
jgi:hypothetical protein